MSDPPAEHPLRYYRATVAYDGAAYFGWQHQPDKPTVQEELERALKRITSQDVRITASGRTDAGVHAIGQVASFSVRTRLDTETLCRALNAYVPRDICLRQIDEAPFDFHAIRDAQRKRYRYVIQDGYKRDVFARHYAWWIPTRLCVETMREAAARLVGEHDFKAYQTSGSERKSTVRHVYAIDVSRLQTEQSDRVVIEIEANGFLYNMVRNIVGSLMLVGRHDQSQQWLTEVLKSGSRQQAGPTAPPQGLYLLWVKYPGD